jgi:ATP-binding cassette subfamily F protein 3
MLQVSNLSKTFGDNLIFERVSFTVNRGERVGLVGPNGCGKTTLLQIILGKLRPDSGSTWCSPASTRIGYLAQALEYEPGQTAGQVMKSAIAGLAEAERHLEHLSGRIATARQGQELQQLLVEYDRALEACERLGAYDVEARTAAILDGLDLRDLGRQAPVDTLSGGEKTRLGLARLLLSGPDLLLLDEPTNHLDINALEWLEGFLQGYGGGMLIVSHDRTFLDRSVTTILDMDPLSRTVTAYPGNYSDYVEMKEREQARQLAAYKDQQEFIAHLQGTIAAKKAYAKSIELGTIDFGPRKIAQGIAHRAVIQQRRLQRLVDSEDRIDKPGRTWQIKLEFPDTPSSGRDVLRLDGVAMAFDRPLFRDVNLTLRAGERIALIGANGSGKTTLARIIMGELEPQAGRARLGAGVQIGYYAQEQENLDPQSTPYKLVRSVAALNQTEIRSLLHYFLFSGDDVFLPVGSLSFGERARLALACLVARGCNFLLLDEPVNHLDIPSRSRFEQAMAAFPGSVLAIVHDRYFIQRFATGLWAIQQGAIRTYVDLEDMRRGQREA